MRSRSGRLAAALAALAVVLLAPLVAWNLFPRQFPARAHDTVAALPLALIAATYLAVPPIPRRLLEADAPGGPAGDRFLLWSATQR